MNLSRSSIWPLATVVWLAAGMPSSAAEDVSAKHYDLIVVGGGSGGFGAALAAARLGVEVLLIEKAGSLGGTSVHGGVHCWEMGAGGTGIPFDLYCRLRKIPDAVGIYSFGRHQSWYDPAREPYRYPGGEMVIDPARRYIDTLQRHVPKDATKNEAFCRRTWHGVPFEPDAMARTMRQMLDQTGHCRVLLNTAMRAAAARDGRVEYVELADGRRVRAAFYIDGTDGRLCMAVGCRWVRGQESRETYGEPSAPEQATEQINGVSLLYRAGPKDTPGVDPLPDGVPEDCWWRKGFPGAHVNHYPNGDLNLNILPTMEGAEFARLGEEAAYAECRRRVLAHWHNLQTRFEEFRRLRITWIAPALGIRESQRIVGEYVLRETDLRDGLSGQRHPDIICLADHSMDTHAKHKHGSGEVREPYGIPYRCLIPKGYRNLLISSRAASFSALAASSCRLSRTMIQLGQAAGTAVALAKQLAVDLPDVPADKLRESLRGQHVQLAHPMPAEIREYLLNSGL